MLLGGLEKLTLIDYPGKLAATVFTIGCNFYCPFCHNPELVDQERIKKQPKISEEVFFDFLKTRLGLLEGVCITGGEPTLQNDLIDFIKKIKLLGFFVKLDTNGTNPDILKNLVKEKMVDYIAMDIKGPFEKYEEMTRRKIDIEKIKKSAEVIRQLNDYEFRMTVLPYFHREEDMLKIGEWLKGSKKFFIQQFRPLKTLDFLFENERPYPIEKISEFRQLLKPYFDYCGVRK